MHRRIETTFAGRPLILETGKMAKLAHGACYVQYGETAVICTATAQDKPTHLPFFPLTVEYREKTYAAGKIPGGFFKREGRPGEKEILSARQIDRPIRPLFPDDYMNETQVHVIVLSADQENDADVLGLLGGSIALNMSKIPFDTPVAAVRLGRIDGQWILNPTFQQLEFSDCDIVVAGSADAITMVEGGALEVPEDEIAEGLQAAHAGIRELIALQEEFLDGLRQPIMSYESQGASAELTTRVQDLAAGRIADALQIADKHERNDAISEIHDMVGEALAEEYPEEGRLISDEIRSIEKKTMRARVLEAGTRIDGRGLDDVREISAEVGLLPRAHGSSLFTRGQTQALGTVTLGTARDEQRIDSIDVQQEVTKSFMLHYNFPPFSTGEAKPIRGTSRREVGHGNLAERAIQPLLPAYDAFPYTIRIVSEVLESNGSSSMATVCAASLALMDAGVPIKAACGGIAMGLIKEGDDVAVLTDILGVEDALGDMDFKVAGTRQGVTSIQMDIKIAGLTVELMKEALQRANRARMHILDEMDSVLAAPREELHEYAPRIITVKINPEKIGDLIGPKGKTIRSIQEQTGAELNVEDDGTVTISSPGGVGGERAREMVAAITEEPEVGRIYEGVVKNTTTFGAFVEILPGTEGLCHISELQEKRTEKTEDVLKPGDITRVKLLAIDEKGRLRLSRKAALAEDGDGKGSGRSSEAAMAEAPSA